MTSLLRRTAAAALAAVGFSVSLPASATSAGIDFTDLWFNPAESGWGVNFIQQNNIIFATLFVYGADRQPHWFVASALTGSTSFSGTLFQTSGPPFTGAWTGGVTGPAVGSMTVTFTSPSTGILNYVVNGQSFSKSIQRQTWAGNNVGGNYIGGMVGRASGCANPANNGDVLSAGLFTAQHANFASGGTVNITVTFRNAAGANGTCSYGGNYTATGRIGTIAGSYTCNVGGAATNGTFTMGEVDVSRNGFNATYSARDNLACNYTGFFGGVRDTL